MDYQYETWMGELLVCPLFDGMNPAEILEALNVMQPEIKAYKEGGQIFYLGESITGFGVFLNSNPKQQPQKLSDRWRVPKPFTPGWVFSELPTFSGSPIPFPVHAKADCHIMFIDRDRFIGTCIKGGVMQKVLENKLGMFARKCQVLKRIRPFYKRRDTADGLYTYLTKQQRIAKDQSFAPSLSSDELAEALGCEEIKILDAYIELEQRGDICRDRNRVRIIAGQK